MKYLKKSFFYLNKSQRFGLYLLFVLIILFEIFQNFSFKKQLFELNEADRILLAEYKDKPQSSYKDSIQSFDPNNYSKDDWIKLGFSGKQADVILKYKQIVGGEFTSKEQLKKCYVIDDAKYLELEPYLFLSNQAVKSNEVNSNNKSVTVYKNFNPNDLPQQGWEKLGFSTKQAEVIMKYKQIVGGKFTSKEQLRKCYVIDDTKYAEMHTYILLPNKSKQDIKLNKKQANQHIIYKRFDPNDFSIKDWKNIGFSSKQAESILNYKKILGGRFKSKDQLRKCYMISDEKFLEMEPYLFFSDIKPIEENEIIKQKVNLTEKFNPNDLTRDEWLKLGFTEKQVNTIFNYKKSLGGKFNIKTLKKCYAISDEKYKEIQPFLIFD